MLAHTSAQTNRQTDKHYRDVDASPYLHSISSLTVCLPALAREDGWVFRAKQGALLPPPPPPQ